MEFELDRSRAKLMDISLELFYYMGYPTQVSPTQKTLSEYKELVSTYPIGFEISNYTIYERIKSVRVLLIPYKEKLQPMDFTFRIDGFMYLSTDIVLEVMFSPDRTMAYTRWHKKGEIPYNYQNIKVERTENGLYYLKPQPNWILFITQESFIKTKEG